ncbi:hypothetical protein FA95DRAFT_1649555 [Auriscalpium vulgare]|uniref:Uncharacterized protein n=1 Tax=Auriscalpium vulgare TaxID=40419 RepID=A0ACB8R8G7_9AGAM|nr:hypothetical protein FA95DRAFT_1649555 [Auriscalpium vulgare]
MCSVKLKACKCGLCEDYMGNTSLWLLKAVLSPFETPGYADRDISETIKPEHCSETLNLDRTLGPVGDALRCCATMGCSGNEVGGECNMCRAEGNKGMFDVEAIERAENAKTEATRAGGVSARARVAANTALWKKLAVAGGLRRFLDGENRIAELSGRVLGVAEVFEGASPNGFDAFLRRTSRGGLAANQEVIEGEEREREGMDAQSGALCGSGSVNSGVERWIHSTAGCRRYMSRMDAATLRVLSRRRAIDTC